MRPVTKWTIPSAVDPKLVNQYNPWSDAKDLLEKNIDAFCSYCEKPITDESMHVEHVQPKSLPKYIRLQYSWSNFLVSCQRCNGTDNKGDKDVIFNQIHLPHRDNTFESIHYLNGGLVVVNPTLNSQNKQKAQNLIDLVGLSNKLGDPNHKKKDKRWERRFNIWVLAEEYLKRYKDGKTNLRDLVELAHGKGFWSVWMTIFKDHPEVKAALVDRFKGTNNSYNY